jgi:hypothetical protein
MVGFAKIVGDLIAGLREVMLFFGLSVAVAALFVYLYTWCIRSTLLLVRWPLPGWCGCWG